MRTIREEKARLQTQLDQLQSAPDLDAGHSALTGLLDLLGDVHRLYRLAGDPARKVLNQACFTKIYIDETEGAPFVARDDLTDTIRPLVETQRAALHDSAAPQQEGGTVLKDSTAVMITPTVLLGTALTNGGSSKTAMVELRGLEPLTFCLPDKCSTN